MTVSLRCPARSRSNASGSARIRVSLTMSEPTVTGAVGYRWSWKFFGTTVNSTAKTVEPVADVRLKPKLSDAISLGCSVVTVCGTSLRRSITAVVSPATVICGSTTSAMWVTCGPVIRYHCTPPEAE